MQEIKTITIRFDKHKAETPRAYLIQIANKEYWLPKKLCRDYGIYGNDIHGRVTIPTWLFNEKFDAHVSTPEDLSNYYFATAGYIIHKHIPEKVNMVASVESLRALSK